MLNKIWFWLLCIGILYGFAKASYQSYTGAVPAPVTAEKVAEPSAPDAPSAPTPTDRPPVGLTEMGKRLNAAVFAAAKQTVTIILTLIGIMALWLGLLNIAKDAGLVDAFARLMRPLMRLIFPEVPDGHPAQGAMLMNLSANMLGLDNAATPLGLKAMRELDTLNPVKDTATNSMAMFLAINTSSITIIPFTLIGYRVAAGSKNPTAPIGGILVATLISTIVAILITRWMSRWPRFQVTSNDPEEAVAAADDTPRAEA